jgi:hypothetical protein
MKIILVFFIITNFLFAQKINLNKSKNKDTQDNSVFKENLIVTGGKEQLKVNKEGIVHYINGDIKDEEIKKIRIKKENYKKSMNGLYKNIAFNNQTINYNLDLGLPQVVNILKGYSTTLKFIDDYNRPIKIEGISLGNKIITLKYPEKNMLEIEPTISFQQTNLNVRLKGFDNPVIFKIREGYENLVDINLNIRISSFSSSNRNISDLNFKKQILKEVFKYHTLKGKPLIDYQVFNLDTKRLVDYFNQDKKEDKLKVFRVERNGKEYNIVVLDNNFEIVGKSPSLFSKYSENNTVYFLPLGTQVFTIETIMDNKKDKLSLNRIKDLGLKETYKIVLLD